MLADGTVECGSARVSDDVPAAAERSDVVDREAVGADELTEVPDTPPSVSATRTPTVITISTPGRGFRDSSAGWQVAPLNGLPPRNANRRTTADLALDRWPPARSLKPLPGRKGVLIQ